MTIDTTYLDNGADKIKLARPAILAMAQKINAIETAGTSSGASIVAFKQSGVGAVDTDVQSILQATVRAKGFGAIWDGIADDTAALQKAHDSLPATGGVIELPNGTGLVSSVTFTKPIILKGNGQRATVIKSTSTTLDTIIFTGVGSGIKDIGFTASVVKVAGAFIKMASAWKSKIENVELQKYYIGIDVDNVVGCSIRSVNALDGVAKSVSDFGAIIRIGETAYCGGLNIEDVVGDVNNTSLQPANGILIRYADVLTVKGALIIHHTDCLKIQPKSGQFSSLIKVIGCDFDTATRGIRIDPLAGGFVTRCTISDTWAGANTSDGVFINGNSGEVDGVHFSGLMAIGNGAIGVNVTGANAKNITFTNSQSAGNVGNGLQVTAGANATWGGGALGSTDRAGGNGTNGFAVDATSTGAVRDCRLDNNVSGPFSNLNTSGFITSGNTPYSWQTDSCAVSSLGGSITTASGQIHWKRVNKSVHWTLTVSITTNGTGALGVVVALPFTSCAGATQMAIGRENAGTGHAVVGLMSGSSSNLTIWKYDGSYPGGNGYSLSLSGTTEVL